MSTNLGMVAGHLNWQKIQNLHGVEPAALWSLILVESAGYCFDSSGNPLIRYERHVMWRALRAKGIDPASLDAPDWLLDDVWSGYRCPPSQCGWRAYLQAHRIAPVWQIEASAIEACSWGFGQILGEGWPQLGYVNAGSFRLAQSTVAGQIACFLGYLASRRLFEPLDRHQWGNVALRYNGPAAQATYTLRLQKAYARTVKTGVPPHNPALPDTPQLPAR